MLAIASQIILCLVLAALLGLIIGYLLGRSNCPKNTYKTGAIHDPHTADDGDCGDAEEADEANTTTSTADASDDADMEVNAEPQGLMQTADEASEEVEATAEGSADSEATSAETDEAVPALVNTEADKETAGEGTETENTAVESEAAVAGEEASSEEEPEAPSDDDKPATLLDAPRDGKKDNLTRIKGIGVKIDALLNSVGVYHFDQIAAWTDKEASWIDHHLSFPGRSKRDDWVGQAKLLAEGKETEFSKRVDAGEVASSKKG